MANFLYSDMEQDMLGVQCGLRSLLTSYIPMLVKQGKWFTICHKVEESQQDLMKIPNKEGTTLGQVIANEYEDFVYRNAIYRYFIRNYLCYVEVPDVHFKTDLGVQAQTFTKFLATANTHVMAEWLGVSDSELPEKYSNRVRMFDYIDTDSGMDGEVPCVKLMESKQGTRTISIPRADVKIDAKGTRVIPLFMLKAGVDALSEVLMSGVAKVSFMKDNGSIRDIFTTLNLKKVREIYGTEGSFLDECATTCYDGDFINNPTLFRGYIRVPEIGGSVYDSATRSINYARICKIDTEEEPDLSFIHIDLDSVVPEFQTYIYKLSSKDIPEVIDMLIAFDISHDSWKPDGRGVTPSKDLLSLDRYLAINQSVYSTVFARELCCFMLANPQWFAGYDGTKRLYNSSDVGLE